MELRRPRGPGASEIMNRALTLSSIIARRHRKKCTKSKSTPAPCSESTPAHVMHIFENVYYIEWMRFQWACDSVLVVLGSGWKIRRPVTTARRERKSAAERKCVFIAARLIYGFLNARLDACTDPRCSTLEKSKRWTCTTSIFGPEKPNESTR